MTQMLVLRNEYPEQESFQRTAVSLPVMAALLFVPAWTLDYWQAWTFLVVYFAASLTITPYLMKADQKLLARRMSGGVIAAVMPVLIWTLLDEEKFLARNLPGYTEYQGRVRYRLMPLIW